MKRIARNCALALVVGALALPASANHKWGKYHWQTAAGVVEVPVIDHTSGTWPAHVTTAVNTWNNPAAASPAVGSVPDVIEVGLSSGATSNTACGHVMNQIHVCADDYGANGWLGIASISIGGGRHIIAGSTKLNDYYFSPSYSGGFYNTSTWRQLVTCQEIGHDFGLGHQNENFQTNATDSCMEYTSTPDSNDETPDFHDYEMLGEIYAHDAGTSDGGGNTKPGNGNGGGRPGNRGLGIDPGNGPADWGTPVTRDRRGNPSVYMRNEHGYLVVTHVTWAIGEGPAERGHSHH